ncbi:MAG TPA: hypothetical protein VNN80_11750 [Polyangiaceae bacterium]|nr:hypothetical protein [Polyangiaceae bacterium]
MSLSALCCAAGSHPAQPPREPGREEWLELETPHFSIYTDLTELPARHMAQSLEDARAALLAGAWPGAKGPPGRTRIVAFARPADFDRLSGVGAQFEGVAFAVPGFERWIAFSPGRDTGVPRVVTHELVHDLSHWFLPLQPPWLAEGLAGYLEGARLDYETRDVTVGEVPTGYVNWLKRSGTLMSSSRLFAATAQHSDDVRDGVAFYAGSWYLVFYLLQRHGEAFAAFQRHLLHLVPWRRAWNLAFPELTSEQLDTDMIDFAKTGPFTPVVEAFDRPVFEPEVRRLTPARAHGIRGLLGTLLYVDAGAEIEAAVKLDPAEPSALTAWFHLLPETDSRGRRDIARRAVAGHPDSGEAWLLSARVATEADERRHALERADELMPHHPGVAALLAADELGRGRAARALELVRFAERRSGLSGEVLAVHIRALVALGRCADAAQLVDSSVALLPPTCEDFDAKSASTVNCIQAVRAAYDPNAGSCAAATRSAEVTPPENDAASSR